MHSLDRLAPWKEKIQQKRKQTPFKEFVKEIASWCPASFYKIDGQISRYPKTERVSKLVPAKTFAWRGYDDLAKKKYDQKRGFFDQITELYRASIHPILWDFGGLTENCSYSDTVGWGVRNAYLSMSIGMDCENILYSFHVISNCTDIHNSVGVTNGCANIYCSSGVTQSYQVFFSRYIFNSSDIWFSTNLTGCRECIFCNDITNGSYCINNVSYSPEEYARKKTQILENKKDFYAWYQKLPLKCSNPWSTNSIGQYLIKCDSVENGLFVQQVRNGRNLIMVGQGDDIEDCYDNVDSWVNAERSYANMGASQGTDIYMSMNSGSLHECYYSLYCDDVHHVIGCIGLAHKSFCIFNEQYKEEEWYQLAEQIFSSLEKEGRLGDFFPGSMNPFYFNDTLASLVLGYTKEEVTKVGYLWRDEAIKVDIPSDSETIHTETIEGKDFDESILKKTLIDQEGRFYRIVPMEYAFLKKYNLPLPTTHWMDRLHQGFRYY